MAIYELIDAVKSRPGLVLAAFMLHIGIVAFSLSKRKALYEIESKIENKKRLETAFANYGLK